MRKYHRYAAVFAIVIGLFIAITGLMVQSMDLWSEVTHAPATDPTMQGRRAGLYGPPNFVVLDLPDYTAKPLPQGFDWSGALATAFRAGRPAAAGKPLGFVEFRMAGDRPLARVAAAGTLYSFDAVSGAEAAPAAEIKLKPISSPSVRNTIKDIHRMRWFGSWVILLDIASGLLMCGMIFTGIAFYIQLWKARARLKRRAAFWFAGDWWRTLHRGTAIVSALFLSVIAVTGTILATSSIGVVINTALAGGRTAITRDLSSPLTEGDSAKMLETTLHAYRAEYGAVPAKVVRLRYFAGMPQGVVVTGENTPDQLVYNAATGRRVSLTEPNYPAPGQTFGWQVDETAKKIHRGDAFGISGMWISLLCGFALLYLTVSGAIMYFDLWNRRRQRGKRELFWS
ncbi:PepSY domain-containing protein [Novosphingobium flavum]|uniref:PepSY domain-containing protein n=2 Tax=Novosphingobium flavum TaxID=1778672 RepID=A0A7X1FRZ8_9SPHN|nr:PepSY domain-containing protein [Novosphingobium flavum]